MLNVAVSVPLAIRADSSKVTMDTDPAGSGALSQLLVTEATATDTQPPGQV